MHILGIGTEKQTADQAKTPTETAPPQAGRHAARASKRTATTSTTPDTGPRRPRRHPEPAPPRRSVTAPADHAARTPRRVTVPYHRGREL